MALRRSRLNDNGPRADRIEVFEFHARSCSGAREVYLEELRDSAAECQLDLVERGASANRGESESNQLRENAGCRVLSPIHKQVEMKMIGFPAL